MSDEQLARIIIEEAIHIHKSIGPGMLEKVYKTCLGYRLLQRGLFVEVEKPVPVYFEEIKMDCGYRADIVVERKLIIDTKSIDAIGRLQVAQLLTYLKFLNLRYGLILNFNVVLMKHGIRRVLNGY
jgi:GxxExxY protein